MEGGLVRGCVSPVRKKSENWIGESPLNEQGEAEAIYVHVTGVWLTHKVGEPWDDDTYRAMPYQFGGGFQELAEVLEVSSCGLAYLDWALWVTCCAKMLFIEEKYLARQMCVWMNRDKQSWIRMERWFARGVSELGDGYFLEFLQGVGPGGKVLVPIPMNVVEPGEKLSCGLGRICHWPEVGNDG